EERDESLEVEWGLRDQAARRRDVGDMEGAESRIATEDPEHADALMRPERRPLSVDELLRPGDRGRESDAVLGVADVVVHRLRDRDERDAPRGDAVRVSERVVPSDDHEMVEAEPGDVLEHDGREVERT